MHKKRKKNPHYKRKNTALVCQRGHVSFPMKCKQPIGRDVHGRPGIYKYGRALGLPVLSHVKR